ncbi:hypothetical protein WICPIJ_000777 [Wickerhamomyces pijperi]|uniref:Uncharacterized protein n=1 Tax=Wickerhamomyces pijperi TaxID=599730 RepID=A0A9P8QCW2_WICPI|nr:hypothetical protein WICPIJ_000777 [Wickerhamomyces pijperi]
MSLFLRAEYPDAEEELPVDPQELKLNHPAFFGVCSIRPVSVSSPFVTLVLFRKATSSLPIISKSLTDVAELEFLVVSPLRLSSEPVLVSSVSFFGVSAVDVETEAGSDELEFVAFATKYSKTPPKDFIISTSLAFFSDPTSDSPDLNVAFNTSSKSCSPNTGWVVVAALVLALVFVLVGLSIYFHRIKSSLSISIPANFNSLVRPSTAPATLAKSSISVRCFSMNGSKYLP